MICDSCECNFEPNKKGSGGMNRRFCFNCMPSGLSSIDRKKIRLKLYKEKSSKLKLKIGCQKCGYNKYSGALDWHHLEDNKDYNPSDTLIRNWELYLKEIKKCILVCANCHREIHNGFTCL